MALERFSDVRFEVPVTCHEAILNYRSEAATDAFPSPSHCTQDGDTELDT